jgi:hypothetical protein
MSKAAKDIAESRVDEACEVLLAFQIQAKRRVEARDFRGACQALEQVAAAKAHLRTAEKTLKEVTP